ncbi:N-6 DNA methylase [candidate division WOR-3 bacterium]|nr:N-6 DNA methylase [candidate division WOR-3 bacterium]
MDKINAKRHIGKLVKRFGENISQYKKLNYDEANTRTDFIDPFFENLGWDVANKQGYAEQYREVVREAKVIVAGKHSAPDYSFRIGGIRKFFVEAKKPVRDLKHEISPAYQLRRYAYTAKLPLSILTDFEEFSVYDTRIKPTPKDSASCARIFYCGYKDYLKNIEFIYETFSKEGILQGSFDRYVESNKKKRGTSEVDKEFLKLIDKWREKLAKNIALRNKSLSLYELNFAIQKIVDRIIFLRITEDRQIEDYGKLQILINGTNTYRRLMQVFLHSDKKYNSGLFDFEKDRITQSISVDDKPIKDILKSVYYPESPYEFSVLDVEILGNIYEQFLGKTIRLTPSHQVKIEEKPEVKKAGGVYYTPKYIVEYIVKNTVGKIIKEKAPKQIDKIKLLDPACGSGSFLLGAYQELLNYHLEWYSKSENLRKALKKGQIIQIGKDSYQLTITEKQRILLNNIFGVDIDTQAVEVSKLSLLLKLLEGETEESTGRLFRYTQMKLLPDLSNNIKCGNSLIGPDFYDTQQTTLFDEAEMRRINVFDWESAFPDIFQNGGFDVVIGNPPYVLIGSDREAEQSYFCSGRFTLTSYKTNTYILFLEKGLQLLGSKDSLLGFIIPKSLVFNAYFSKTRATLLRNYAIPQIIEIRDKVFQNAEVGDSILFFAQKTLNPIKKTLKYYKVTNVFPKFDIIEKIETVQSELLINKEAIFYTAPIQIKVPTKELGEITVVSNGLNPGNIRHILLSDRKETSTHKEMVLGRDIQPYFLKWSGTWVNYDSSLRYRVKISDTKSKDGMTPQKRVDFALRKPEIYKSNKILIRKTADYIIATYDTEGFYYDSLAYGVQLNKETNESILYIVGLLNSSLIGFIHNSYSMNKGKTFAKVLAINLKKLPIRKIDFSNPSEKAMHDKLVAMVEKMLKLQKKFHSARLENDKRMYKTQIDILDKQIDSLVYKLYGLTKEEIKIIKSGS